MKRFKRFTYENVRLITSPLGIVLDVHFEDCGAPRVVEVAMSEDKFAYDYPLDSPEDVRSLEASFCLVFLRAYVAKFAEVFAPWLAFALALAVVVTMRFHPVASLPFH